MDEPYLSVRVAQYEGDIARIVQGFSPELVPTPIGYNEVCKYSFLRKDEQGSDMLMISKLDPRAKQTNDYNVLITVHGRPPWRVESTMDDFVKHIGIETRTAPDQLRDKLLIATKKLIAILRSQGIEL